jgi:hypothetical protein
MELSIEQILYAIAHTTGCTENTVFNLLLLQSLVFSSRNNFSLNTRYCNDGVIWSYYAVNYKLSKNGHLSFSFVFRFKNLVAVNRFNPQNKKYHSFIVFGDYNPMNVIIDKPVVIEQDTPALEPKSWPKLESKPAPAPAPAPAPEPEPEPEPAPLPSSPKTESVDESINRYTPSVSVPENTVCSVVYDREANIDNLSEATPSTDRIKLSLNQILKVRKAVRKPSIQDYGDGFLVKTSNDSKTLIVPDGRNKINNAINNLKIDMKHINHIEYKDQPRLNNPNITIDYNDEKREWNCPCGGRGNNLLSISLHWQTNKHYTYDQEFA